jgi:hypothetical protein
MSMREKRNAYGILVGKHWEDQDVIGWTKLKWILDGMGWHGLDRSGSG